MAFLYDIVSNDITRNKSVVTRFPPEPNGYLHLGHAKALSVDFGIAKDFNGKCILRMDDTNPLTEKHHYVDAIESDVKWLGYEPAELTYASDYFDKMITFALKLIETGDAYVDDQTNEQIHINRGSIKEPGTNSIYRTRSCEENLYLFTGMIDGKYPPSERVLRAKISMTDPNPIMRDPVLYRIMDHEHYRQGKKYKVYPTYDWAHPLEDLFENITHSFCSLEFVSHRPLYEWVLAKTVGEFPCKQIEFSRLNLEFTLMSKRKLLRLVEENYVTGWDDPRMPTISGLRRRGYTPDAINNFIAKVGVTKTDAIIKYNLLESCILDDLNSKAPRRMAVIDPLKITIRNWSEGESKLLEDRLMMTKTIYIERSDFAENPPPKFFRLSPKMPVRLRYGYVIHCVDVIKEDGKVVEVICDYDESSLGNRPTGARIKGVIHWVSAECSELATIRLYDKLFTEPKIGEIDDYLKYINPQSLITVKCPIESSLKLAKIGESFQFERIGFFCVDSDSTNGNIIFNLTVKLNDSWNKSK